MQERKVFPDGLFAYHTCKHTVLREYPVYCERCGQVLKLREWFHARLENTILTKQ